MKQSGYIREWQNSFDTLIIISRFDSPLFTFVKEFFLRDFEIFVNKKDKAPYFSSFHLSQI